MKPLLPTLRERQRYISYEIITARPMGIDASSALLERLAGLLGVFDTAQAGLLSVHYDVRTQTGILRTTTTMLDRVKAAMVLITHLGRTRVALRTLGVSGVIQKAKARLPGEQHTHKKNLRGLRR